MTRRLFSACFGETDTHETMLEMLCSLGSFSKVNGNSCCCCSPLFAAALIAATFDKDDDDDMFIRDRRYRGDEDDDLIGSLARNTHGCVEMRADVNNGSCLAAVNDHHSSRSARVSVLHTDCCRAFDCIEPLARSRLA